MPLKEQIPTETYNVNDKIRGYVLEVEKGIKGNAAINTAGSSSHSITSIFSPYNSFIIFWILTPFWPTHEPTGSIFSFVEYTATLLLEPASLDIFLISIKPSYISGISNSNNLLTKSGWLLETITCGFPFIPFSTSKTYPLILSLTL